MVCPDFGSWFLKTRNSILTYFKDAEKLYHVGISCLRYGDHDLAFDALTKASNLTPSENTKNIIALSAFVVSQMYFQNHPFACDYRLPCCNNTETGLFYLKLAADLCYPKAQEEYYFRQSQYRSQTLQHPQCCHPCQPCCEDQKILFRVFPRSWEKVK